MPRWSWYGRTWWITVSLKNRMRGGERVRGPFDVAPLDNARDPELVAGRKEALLSSQQCLFASNGSP
jgi:hypothetical protein